MPVNKSNLAVIVVNIFISLYLILTILGRYSETRHILGTNILT